MSFGYIRHGRIGCQEKIYENELGWGKLFDWTRIEFIPQKAKPAVEAAGLTEFDEWKLGKIKKSEALRLLPIYLPTGNLRIRKCGHRKIKRVPLQQ